MARGDDKIDPIQAKRIKARYWTYLDGLVDRFFDQLVLEHAPERASWVPYTQASPDEIARIWCDDPELLVAFRDEAARLAFEEAQRVRAEDPHFVQRMSCDS